MIAPIRHPVTDPPPPGAAAELADGILWLRLPLPMALDHVNVYALDDGAGWTILDTGMHSRRSIAIWESLISGPLAGRPVSRVIVTHHHPDHVGMAGWFLGRGAELMMPRTAWLFARMLTLDDQTLPTAESLIFWRRAGMPEAGIARRATERPFNFCDIVAPLPPGFIALEDGARLMAGGRQWTIRFGQGHAPDHATLWSRDDALVLGGDQFLPDITPNIGVYPTEPGADPLSGWLASARAFQPLAREDHFVLPGHKLPFTGLPLRLSQTVEGHETALDRLRIHLASPRTAVDCFPVLFRRAIVEETYGMALAEAVAHLNHLLHRGEVSRTLGPTGAWHWRLNP